MLSVAAIRQYKRRGEGVFMCLIFFISITSFLLLKNWIENNIFCVLSILQCESKKTKYWVQNIAKITGYTVVCTTGPYQFKCYVLSFNSTLLLENLNFCFTIFVLNPIKFEVTKRTLFCENNSNHSFFGQNSYRCK